MKYLVLSAVLILSLAACKRRPGQVPTHGDIRWSNSTITASADVSTLDLDVDISSEMENTPVENPSFSPGRRFQQKKSISNLDSKEPSGDLRTAKIPESKPLKRAQVVKEIPTALSNALWMSGIGLGGMLLMLLLFAWFDTSVFFVLFGIIFLVGVISLLMYKVTHKKKIQQ